MNDDYERAMFGAMTVALVVALVLLAERVAGLGALVSAVPWPVRYLVLPLARVGGTLPGEAGEGEVLP